MIPARHRNTRQLIARAVILSRTRFSEHWLWDAVEGVRQTTNDNPAGYFRASLSRGSRLPQPDFDAVLEGTKVPRSFYAAWDEFRRDASPR